MSPPEPPIPEQQVFDLGHASMRSHLLVGGILVLGIATAVASALLLTPFGSAPIALGLAFGTAGLWVSLRQLARDGDRIVVRLLPSSRADERPRFEVVYNDTVVRSGTLADAGLEIRALRTTAGRFQHLPAVLHQVRLEIGELPEALRPRSREGLVLSSHSTEAEARAALAELRRSLHSADPPSADPPARGSV